MSLLKSAYTYTCIRHSGGHFTDGCCEDVSSSFIAVVWRISDVYSQYVGVESYDPVANRLTSVLNTKSAQLVCKKFRGYIIITNHY